MKRMKKFVSLLLTLVMVAAMAIPAFAGSITIKGTENVPASEKEFKAYKILDVEFPNDENGETDYSRMAYKVPEALVGFYAEEFGLDASEASFAQDVVAKIAALRAEGADDNADGNGDLRAFMSRALKAAKEAGIPGASGAKDGNDYKIENLASGYYVVEDVTEAPTDGSDYAVSALMLDTTTPDAEITIKTDKPSIDKKIVEGEGDNATETNANNAAIGEAVSYKVTSKVPDMTHYNTYTFIVTDTFSKGLTYNKDLTITVGGEVVDASLYEETSETEADGVTKLTINFKDFKANFGKKTGEDIVITYTATVNKDAIIGSAGNKNSVKLTYSNDPNHSGEGDNSTVDTPEVDVFTYVTGLQITKVDATNPDMKLTGAQFKIEGEGLEKALVKGYEFVEDPNGEFYKDGDVYTTSEVEGSKKYSKKEVNKTEESVVKVDYVAEVGEDGVLSLDGLCEGIYTITEVKAPNGYNILKKPIKIQIKCNTDNVTADQTECSWAYRKSDENGDLPNDETTGYVTLDSETPIIAFDVENTTGVELPSTGGIGTTIFYVLGSILLIGAGVLLVTKKKMAGRE